MIAPFPLEASMVRVVGYVENWLEDVVIEDVVCEKVEINHRRMRQLHDDEERMRQTHTPHNNVRMFLCFVSTRLCLRGTNRFRLLRDCLK